MFLYLYPYLANTQSQKLNPIKILPRICPSPRQSPRGKAVALSVVAPTAIKSLDTLSHSIDGPERTPLESSTQLRNVLLAILKG